jgi:hypothetical protein
MKLFVEVKKVCKRPQKKSKIMFLSAKKKANVKKMFINNFKAKDLEKE